MRSLIAKFVVLAERGLWLLPASRSKNRLLNLCGHDISLASHVGPTLVLGALGRHVVADGVVFAGGNVLKSLETLRLERSASVGRFNLFSAHSAWRLFDERGSSVHLKDSAFVTSRHSFDCTSGITIGRMSGIGGHGTEFLTHSLDVKSNLQGAAPISVGNFSFVSSRCLVLGGATVGERSLVAAGAVVRPGTYADEVLLAGVPASPKGATVGKWFERTIGPTRSVRNRQTLRSSDF